MTHNPEAPMSGPQTPAVMTQEQLQRRLDDAAKHERHRNTQETMYWFNQYKLLARDAVAALTATPTPLATLTEASPPDIMKRPAKSFSEHCRTTLIHWWEKSGLTQRQLAQQMDWKEQTSVSQYFRGRSDLSLDQAVRMACTLGHSMSDLVASWEGNAMKQQDDKELELLMAYRRADLDQRAALLAVAAVLGKNLKNEPQDVDPQLR